MPSRFLDASRTACRSLLHAFFLSLCSTGWWVQVEGGHRVVAERVATAELFLHKRALVAALAAVLQPAAQHSLISCKRTPNRENRMETKSSYRNFVSRLHTFFAHLPSRTFILLFPKVGREGPTWARHFDKVLLRVGDSLLIFAPL